MIQLSVKEAFDLVDQTKLCNYSIHDDISWILNSLGSDTHHDGIIGELQGDSQVKSMLLTIAKSLDTVSTSIMETDKKLDAFVNTQFESYVQNAERLNNKYADIISRFNALAADIDKVAPASENNYTSSSTATSEQSSEPKLEPIQDVNPFDTSTTGGSNAPVSFWDSQAQNFASDWDYSQCNGAIDYVGATLRGIVKTPASAIDFVASGLGEVLNGIFGGWW